MAVEVQLGAASGALAAGRPVGMTARVATTGQVVDGVGFQVLGPLAPFARVEPPSVQLMPGTWADVTVVLDLAGQPTPPAGVAPLALRAWSTVTGEQVVAESTVAVEATAQLAARLAPVRSKGKRGAKHAVVVRNEGNAPLAVELDGRDPDDALEVAVRPAHLELPPGGEAEGTVALKPTSRRTRGELLPFRVTASATVAGAAPGTPPTVTALDGQHQRKRGHGCLTTLALLLVVLVGAGALVAQRASAEARSIPGQALHEAGSLVAPVVASRIDAQNDADARAGRGVPPATGAGSALGPADQAAAAHRPDLQGTSEAREAVRSAAGTTEQRSGTAPGGATAAAATAATVTLTAKGPVAYAATERGAVDLDRDRYDVTHREDGAELRVLVVDDDVLVRGRRPTPAGTPWGRLERDGSVVDGGAALGSGAEAADRLLAALRKVGTVQELAPGDLDGRPVRRFATEVTAEALAGALPGAGSLFRSVKADVEVLTDPAAAELRRVVVTLRYRSQTLTAVVDLGPLGAEPAIVAPPAAEVADIRLRDAADLAEG